MTGLVVDNFAGGGGASTGIEQALGRAVDIAINHDAEALAMHAANHPGTVHVRNNIWRVDPVEVTGGKPVELAWFSPDCKHFSKAKGGKPREKSIRDLAWVVVHWVSRMQQARKRAGDPDWRQAIRLILLENVEEFRTWGPLDEDGQPIKERAGETFDQWCRELRKLGYRLQFRELRACDYGAPTIRKRFFMIARCDGLPIVWPEPTHGAPDSPDVLCGKKLPWRTAAEIIDWSIPCPSIFERKKPLADKTLRRIAHGIVKFVLDNPKPFIVPLTHHGSSARSYSSDAPLHTVTGAHRGELAIVAPHVTKFRAGAVGHRADEPLHTVTANSFVKRPGGCAPLGIVEATLSPVIVGCGGRRGQSGPVGPEQPFPTITAKADACLVTAQLAPFFARTAHGDVDSKGKRRGKGQHPAAEPFPTISTSQDSALVTATLAPFVTYAQQGGANRSAEDPLHTVCASKKDQNCVVTAKLAPLVIGTAFKNTRAARAFDILEPLRTQTAQPEYAVVACNMVHLGNGERQGQAPRAMSAEKPLGTVVATKKHALVQAFLHRFGNTANNAAVDAPIRTITTAGGSAGGQHAVVTAHIEQANGSPEGEKPLAGRSAEDPLSTIVSKGCTQRLVTSNLLKLRGTSRDGQKVDEPLHTISAQGTHMAEVRAFLLKYYGNESEGHDPDGPLGTVTTKDRFGLVTVSIGGEEYVIVDIGMRMLTPRELFNAQGFPPDYIIDRDARGKPTTKTSQVARCGNSVCPPLAEALTDANAPSLMLARLPADIAEKVAAA